jgi:hypothetical protein
MELTLSVEHALHVATLNKTGQNDSTSNFCWRQRLYYLTEMWKIEAFFFQKMLRRD